VHKLANIRLKCPRNLDKKSPFFKMICDYAKKLKGKMFLVIMAPSAENLAEND